MRAKLLATSLRRCHYISGNPSNLRYSKIWFRTRITFKSRGSWSEQIRQNSWGLLSPDGIGSDTDDYTMN